MDSTDLKDKIILDPGDSQDMKEIFSRMQPGEKVSGGRWSGRIDEAGEKVICISIDEISIHRPNDSDLDVKTEKKEGEEEEPKSEGPEGAGVEIYKDEDNVPVQEGTHDQDNVPSETQPPP